MTVFKIYINGISDGNLIFRSDVSTALTGYGDTILSPKLKKETNKADSFEFMILPSHEKYGSFEKKKTFVFLTRDDKCIFRGRVSDVKTDIYKQRTITCEGDLAFLADSIQPPNKKNETSSVGSTKKKKNATVYSTDGGRTYTVVNNKDTLKMTPEAYFRTCIDVHNGQMTNSIKNFTVGSVTVTGKGTNEYFERTSYQDTSSVISSDLLSVYGGVLRTRYENGQAYIDWLDAYTETNGQEIRFGVNMIDLDQEPPTDEIWSVLLPTGEENCTIESKNNGSKFLENSDAIEQYGYIVHHHAFSNVKKADELLTKARKYMSTHCKIFPNNLVIKAIDLQLIGESTDPLELGDKIKVVSSPHGLNKTMACIAMELDIYNPENNSYTIGTILPPDKEKKKEPLSEKHKNSHGSSSRGIANNANAISGLQNDVNVNANNINVNAENIAVNALNIAVNAENIAVVAKNISIAAETIDIKAQEITATFGEETDELYGHITTSAEGIKTEFHDNTTGLSSYFTQEAGKITTAVENAKTDVYTKIEQTETSITKSFHNVIYGEDGNSGIVGDYKREIVDTAAGTVDRMEATLYGRNADGSINYDNPTGYYKRVRDESVSHSVDSFHKEIYGEGGTAENPKGGSAFDAVYTKTSELSQEYFKQTLYGDGSAENPDVDTVLYAVYNKSAAAWSNALWGDGTKDNPASGSILYGTNQEIGARVKQGDVESGFKITGTNLSLFSKTISLSGFVTVDKLSAVDGNITNLVNGTTKASYLSATKMKVTTGNFYIGDKDNTSGKFYYHGSEYYDVTISMPNVGETNGFLGWAYKGGNYTTTLSLAHSHSVTTNSDGTITLGGTVATDSPAANRSFKIADTKTYKDGVSAVVITSLNKDPSASVSYDTENNKYTVPLKAVASNSNFKTANYTFFATDAYNAGYTDGTPNDSTWSIPNFSSEKNWQLVAVVDDGDGVHDCATFRVQFNDNKGKTHTHTFDKIPCWDVYDHGVNSVGVKSVGLNNIDYPTEGVGDSSSFTGAIFYRSSEKKFYVRLRSTATNEQHRESAISVPGDKAYDAGWSEGYGVGGPSDNWWIPQYSDTHTRQMVAAADDDDGVKDCVTFKVRFYDKYGTMRGHTFTKIPCWDVYNNGKASVTITSLGRRQKTGGEYYDDEYSSSENKYTIYAGAIASNGATLNHNFVLYATEAYNAGYSTGKTDGVNSVRPASVSIRATSEAVADDDTRKDCANIYLSITASNGTAADKTITKVPMWMVYDEGRKDCITKDATVTGVTINANGSADVHLKWSDYTRTINVNSRYVSDNHN